MVLLKGVLRIEELDPIWLAKMWREASEPYRDMLDIIFMLYLLICRI
jgi:hypothetical protein